MGSQPSPPFYMAAGNMNAGFLWLLTKHFLVELLPQIHVTCIQVLRPYRLSILYLKFWRPRVLQFWSLQIMEYSHRDYWLNILVIFCACEYFWMYAHIQLVWEISAEATELHQVTWNPAIRWSVPSGCELPNLRAGSWVWVLCKEQQDLLTGESTLPLHYTIFVKGIFRYLFTYIFYSFNF